MSSLAKSTAVTQADSHTYTIDFDPAWTIGTGTYISLSHNKRVPMK